MSKEESAADIVERMLGESGSAVVRLVRESSNATDARMAQAAEAIHKAVDAKVKGVESSIRSSSDTLAKQQAALRALAQKVDGKVDKTELATLKALIAQAGRTLALAMEDVNQAASSTDPDQADKAADKAAKQAERAGEYLNESAERLATLEERVSELEKWRKEVVEPALGKHRESIDDHEERLKKLESPKKASAPAGNQQAAMPEVPVRTKIIERANPRNWGWLSWALAILFGLAALVIALTMFCPWISHVLNQQWAWLRMTLSFLAGLVLVSISFFGGGLLGHALQEVAEKDDK